jgi:hypothetical protein
MNMSTHGFTHVEKKATDLKIGDNVYRPENLEHVLVTKIGEEPDGRIRADHRFGSLYFKKDEIIECEIWPLKPV